MPTESQMVTWTLESNEDGKWALMMRTAGLITQMSDWYDSPQALREAIRQKFHGSAR